MNVGVTVMFKNLKRVWWCVAIAGTIGVLCSSQVDAGKGGKPFALVNPAFVVMDGSSIKLLSSDAQTSQTLVSGGNVDRSTPVWSPDGNWIAYVLRDRSGTQIRLMDKYGGNSRIVMAFSKGSPTLPHWYSRLQWVPGEVDRLLMRNIDGRSARFNWRDLIRFSAPAILRREAGAVSRDGRRRRSRGRSQDHKLAAARGRQGRYPTAPYSRD